ncbi:type II toxin-antitoxin system RelE/ParE family toxin [Pararhizobium sp.]|uniref:type II toxin-antitoxin system RelE/ParE family toxin n=1 Tax=Pararhizobium sp. TaxID=1977563 RepID=UPI00271D09C0|nr:type II toxin-antitoxin system RelE/ParE family toxin [Pararhizobium sp.]MDO9417181.1 type II toxin-antitoxin system RelE/ParE family toxin [Pararhizobium sp.]
MSYSVRFSKSARGDMIRHYAYLLDSDESLAIRAFTAIQKSMVVLEEFPFSCRKASAETPLLRELIIPFGASGYIALFEIGEDIVTILAIRHQREDDYH